MSVFGGDSWAREAQYRKRRVNDLVAEGIDESCYKKLSNGKYACLVCPNNPVLDTPLMLSTHMKGSRHRSAETSKMKQRGSSIQIQCKMNKRIAVSECSVSSEIPQHCRSSLNTGSGMQGLEKKMVDQTFERGYDHSSTVRMTEAAGRTILKQRYEEEINYTSAGWKRDCHGRWFKDENAEFDSDEEDPNISLSS